MRYIDLEGMTATGTVWAPGPVANSVWVIEDGHCPRAPGSAIVVKLSKGDVSAASEFDYALPEFIDDHRHGPRWMHNNGRDHRGLPRLSCVQAVNYRHAPQLPEKVWRAAVGDQCVQLELVAA